MRKSISLFLLFILLVSSFTSCSSIKTEHTPLACLSLITNDDSFPLEISQAFEDALLPLGYRIQIVFCDNNIGTQRMHIENFISNDADLMLVHTAGNSNDYVDLFAKAQKSDCKVIVMAREILDYCDVQSLGYSFLKGIAKCELVKEFLNKQYPYAPAGSVTVLVLENLSKTGYIMTSAGMRLLNQKYLRYFDYINLEFINEETDDIVYYFDDEGRSLPVDENTGGLILNEKGYAMLNPCYDERVALVTASNKDITTVLDGQNAIDYFIATPNGTDLKVVISFSGDAAVGANQRMMHYYRSEVLTSDINDYAVFGSDDTETNRNLMLKSTLNKSMYRGFVGYKSVYWEITTMIDMVLDDDNTNTLLELEVLKGKLNDAGDSVELKYENYNFWRDYNIFLKWE